MEKERFKTKLTKRQKRKNLLVFLTVIVCAYAFVLLFGSSIGVFEGWSVFEIYTLALALSFFVLSMLLFPLLIAAVVLGFQKGRAGRVKDDATFLSTKNIDYYRDDLSELSPALVSLLIDLDIYGKKDIAATLLRMKNKHVLSFQKDGRILPTGNHENQLDEGEAELLYIIKKGGLNSRRVLSYWKENRFREAEKKGYIQRSTEKKKISGKEILAAGIAAIAALSLWGGFFAFDLYSLIENAESGIIILFLYLLLIDALLCLPFYFLTKKAGYLKRGDVIWERTALGNETAEKIAGLGRFIHAFSMLSEAKKEQVALWEDYLVYALVLEENEKIVKDISRLYKINLQRFDRLHLLHR